MIDVDISRIAFDELSQLSKTDKDYATRPELFNAFTSLIPAYESFQQAIDNRTEVDRELLVSTLKSQYGGLDEDSGHVEALLNPDHFTVTTAHQPSLFTGPLYFIYKICSVIHLARQLTKRYPGCTFSPVFIIGGEDHDFAEMNHCNLFGREFTWTTDQGGSVGRMHTDDLKEILTELSEVLGSSPHAEHLRTCLQHAFTPGRSYGQCMQKFVMELFRGTGLIVLQMDDPSLKRAFIPVMRDELLHSASRPLIAESQAEIEAAGYKPQAYLRDINLFYLTDNDRCRIERDGAVFTIVGSDLTFKEDELISQLEEYPERFSPNVNLRPVYQEMILPNLAYIGGGGEIAYWLERKRQFAHFGVSYPMLIRRNSVLHINKGMHKLRKKLDLSKASLFEHVDENIAAWIQAHAEHEIDIQDETDALGSALDALQDKARAIDPTLAKKVEAYKAKALKDIDGLGKRLVRAEKAQHESSLQKVRKLHDKLFPKGGLQERHDNFMPFYLAHGKEYLDTLIQILDPLEPGFIILEETL